MTRGMAILGAVLTVFMEAALGAETIGIVATIAQSDLAFAHTLVR